MGPGPVSYTHLDVYKRQVKVFGKVEIHLRHGRLEFNLAVDIVDEAILGVDVMNTYGFIINFKNKVLRIGGVEAVSYTHLDVYKRQENPF